MSYEPLPHDSKAPEPSGILPLTSPDSHPVWTIEVDTGSGQRYGDAVMNPGRGAVPPAPPEPLSLKFGTSWDSANVYKIGETIWADVAVFEGGTPGHVVYRYRWQERPDEDSSWTNTKWTSYLNQSARVREASHVLTNPGRVRIQCQARDDHGEADEVDQVNSFASVQEVDTYTMGEAEVWDNADPDETRITNGGTEYVEVGAFVTYVADVTGTVPRDKLKYEWKVRNGYAQIRGETDLPYCSVLHGHIVNDTSSLSCSISCEPGYVNENLGFMWTSRYVSS